jgi:hypothetical protein
MVRCRPPDGLIQWQTRICSIADIAAPLQSIRTYIFSIAGWPALVLQSNVNESDLLRFGALTRPAPLKTYLLCCRLTCSVADLLALLQTYLLCCRLTCSVAEHQSWRVVRRSWVRWPRCYRSTRSSARHRLQPTDNKTSVLNPNHLPVKTIL